MTRDTGLQAVRRCFDKAEDIERMQPAGQPSFCPLCDFYGKPWQEVPNTAWCGTMVEARRWAEKAHEEYRKAVCVAAFEAMKPESQSAFLAYLRERRRAK